jgi:uncharacterized membrane protein YqjE
MPHDSPEPTGFLGAFKALGDGLLASVEDRLKLFGIELQEEKLRLIQIFIWISSAVFTCVMAITFASLTLVYLFWESARLAALGGLTLLYTGALVTIVVAFRRYLARQPAPFDATLGEIANDRACIQPKS